MNYYDIGQRIRKYRKAKGLSQESLSEQIGISVTHMSHIETGNTKLSLPVFVALAEALGVQTDDLLHSAIPSKHTSLNAISELFDACSPEEIRILIEVMRSTHTAIKKYL